MSRVLKAVSWTIVCVVVTLCFIGIGVYFGTRKEKEEAPPMDPYEPTEEPVVIDREFLRKSFNDAVGSGVYLPHQDIYDPQLLDTMEIFKKMPSGCMIGKEIEERNEAQEIFITNEDFYKSTDKYTKVGASLRGAYTMGYTLARKSNHLSQGETKVSGVSLNIYNYVKTKQIKKSCLHETQFTYQFLSELDKLGTYVPKPWLKASWEGYQRFLERFGSHIVNRGYFGSSVRHWTFLKEGETSVDEDSADKLLSHACSNFVKGDKVCRGVRRASLELKTSNRMELLGGEAETRRDLRNKRSKPYLDRFLEEAKYMQAPVRYEYVAIWQVLRNQFTTGKRSAIALNMMQYYMGFEDFGCTLIDAGGVALRYFGYCKSKQANYKPILSCFLIDEGCHSDGDCHIGGAGTVTYCYGQSCYAYKEPVYGKKAKDVEIRTKQKGSFNEGVNESCEFVGATGTCDSSKVVRETIWEFDRPTSYKMNPQEWIKMCYDRKEIEGSDLNPLFSSDALSCFGIFGSVTTMLFTMLAVVLANISV